MEEAGGGELTLVDLFELDAHRRGLRVEGRTTLSCHRTLAIASHHPHTWVMRI